MVCVELDEAGYDGTVVNVVLGDEHDDIGLVRDHCGHFLVYDEAMQRIEADQDSEARAIKISEYREWPARLDWDEGPDALRYPGLYDIIEPDDQDEDDLEPLDFRRTRPRTVEPHDTGQLSQHTAVSGCTSRDYEPGGLGQLPKRPASSQKIVGGACQYLSHDHRADNRRCPDGGWLDPSLRRDRLGHQLARTARHPSPPGVPTASQAQALTPLAAVGVAGVALVIAGVLLAF